MLVPPCVCLDLGILASGAGGRAGKGGRGCYGDGVWPGAPASDASSHWIRSINEMMSTFEVAVTSLILAPLVFCAILHAWHVTSQPDTRNMRAPTDKEKKLYANVLWQDCLLFADWAKWMWYEIKEQWWAFHHSVPRQFLALPDLPPFHPDYDASEYEPYTDADCWRSVFEVVHQVDAELDERLQAAECLMLRSVAPLVATLDKLRYLPIDLEEAPYAMPAQSSSPARVAALDGSAAARSPGTRRPGDHQDSVHHHSPAAHPPPDEWELEDAEDTEAAENGEEGMGNEDDDDVSEVATVVEVGQRAPKGVDLRLVAKVLQLRSVSALPLPKSKSWRKKATTLAEHLHGGLGLAFDFSLHGQVRRRCDGLCVLPRRLRVLPCLAPSSHLRAPPDL